MRPHFPGGTYFGLEPFRTSSWREVLERAHSGAGAKPRTIAERFRPALPRRLPPGKRWSGEFSGRAALPVGVPIRVVLGRFVAVGPAPRSFSADSCASRSGSSASADRRNLGAAIRRPLRQAADSVLPPGWAEVARVSRLRKGRKKSGDQRRWSGVVTVLCQKLARSESRVVQKRAAFSPFVERLSVRARGALPPITSPVRRV
jgi:hypothetical protein